MTLADLDHAISTLEHSATADAVSETLEFLRGLRERAVEGVALAHFDGRIGKYVRFSYNSPDVVAERLSRALLILAPEDS